MRHPPIMVPKGRLQICCKFCQVSASCHSSAMTPNNTADAPKTIGPHNAVFIRKKQRCRCLRPVAQARSFPLYVLLRGGHFRSMFCSVSEKRGMHEFAYFSIGGLPTKSGSTASAASQYRLRDLHVNIMLNPHAATQVRMSSYERQAGGNPKVRVADNRGVEPGGLRRLVNLKGWAARQHP